MSRTGIRGSQIVDGTIQSIDIENGEIWREDLNTTSTGKAVVTRVLPGDDISIDYTGVDEGTGEVTINFNSSTGGITASQHRTLDQLVHNIAEDSYCEISRSANKVTDIVWWETNSKIKKIREINIVYSGSFATTVTTRQYDSGGIEVSTMIETINRDVSKNVTSIDTTIT